MTTFKRVSLFYREALTVTNSFFYSTYIGCEALQKHLFRTQFWVEACCANKLKNQIAFLPCICFHTFFICYQCTQIHFAIKNATDIETKFCCGNVAKYLGKKRLLNKTLKSIPEIRGMAKVFRVRQQVRLRSD
jgi:hypothetical protein